MWNIFLPISVKEFFCSLDSFEGHIDRIWSSSGHTTQKWVLWLMTLGIICSYHFQGNYIHSEYTTPKLFFNNLQHFLNYSFEIVPLVSFQTVNQLKTVFQLQFNFWEYKEKYMQNLKEGMEWLFYQFYVDSRLIQMCRFTHYQYKIKHWSGPKTFISKNPLKKIITSK